MGEVGHDVGVLVQDGRDEHRRGTVIDGLGESLGERGRRERRYLHDGDPFLGQAVELAADRVKLARSRDETGSVSQGQCREPSDDQLVGVGAQGDRPIRVVEEPREPASHPVGRGERAFPLVVHVLGGIEPGTLLGLEAHVGPGLMRVARQQ